MYLPSHVCGTDCPQRRGGGWMVSRLTWRIRSRRRLCAASTGMSWLARFGQQCADWFARFPQWTKNSLHGWKEHSGNLQDQPTRTVSKGIRQNRIGNIEPVPWQQTFDTYV